MSETATLSTSNWQNDCQLMWNDIQENVYKAPQILPSLDKSGSKLPENSSLHGDSDSSQPNNLPLNDKSNIIKPKPIPDMVFSVIGDSISYYPRPWPKAVFQNALIEAAKGGGETWILYRGSDYEVSNVVQDAYHHYENLEFGEEKVAVCDPRRHIKLIDISGGETKQQSKDDSQTIYKTKQDEEDNCLLYFEQFVSEKEIEYFKEHFKIHLPIAIIVCEGDLKTIKRISAALENKLPIIIMKGSGKAADLVLDYLQNPGAFQKKASILFGIELNDESIADMEGDLKRISGYRDLVAVFDLHRDDPLMFSSIVGEAIVSCMSIGNISPNIKHDVALKKRGKTTRKDSSLAKMHLTKDSNDFKEFRENMKWKTKTYVVNPKYCNATTLPLYFFFGYQILQELKLLQTCGDVLLFEALKANRCNYVKVLLDQGVKFNIGKLEDLYIQTISCLHCKSNQSGCRHMQWILEKLPRAIKFYENLIKNVSENGQNVTQNETIPSNPAKQAAENMCQEILRYKAVSGYSPEKSCHENCCLGHCCRCQRLNKVHTSIEDSPDEESIADVLLWAIFVDRKELAEICWLRGKDHLFTGLVCSAVLKELSIDAHDVKENVLSNHLEKHSKIFEQRCTTIMDRMLEENEERALSLLDSETRVWGIRSSPLTFAYENFMYDVIAHTCSQKYMNEKWYNGLPPGKLAYMWCMVRQTCAFFKSTRTKYIINLITFLFVLGVYSAFVLTSVSTKYYTQTTARALEYTVYIWNGGDCLEEMIGCIACERRKGRSHRGCFSRIKRHLYDFWNVVDLLSYGLLITALTIRHLIGNETHVFARNVFALSLLVMYLRFLEVFLIYRILGPTLMMIKEMLKDLLIFLLIVVFVILGVGIYYHANLWPDHQAMWKGGFTNWSIWKIIYYPYWQLYGEFNLDVLSGNDQTDCNVTSIWESDMSMDRCPHEDWTVPFIAAIFVLFSNLLLVNLVIAMFSYTFERVQNMSEKLWHFQTYTVTIDYNNRIPSPFNIIIRPFIWIRLLILKLCPTCFCCKEPPTDATKDKREMSTLRSFQKIIALRYYNKN